jgi:hypothetical protein
LEGIFSTAQLSLWNFGRMDSKPTEDSPNGDGQVDGDLRRDRRAQARQTSVLRLALFDAGGFTQLCRITNVSLHGLQATVFGSASTRSKVRIRVPDEISLEGTIVWARQNCVGIKLDNPLAYSSLLRFSGDGSAQGRRRRLPRVQIAAPASLTSGGLTYAVELTDISPGGAMVRTGDPLPARGPITLNVPGLPRIAAQIRWATDGRAGLLFNQAVELRTLTDWILEKCGSARTNDGVIMDACTSVAS